MKRLVCLMVAAGLLVACGPEDVPAPANIRGTHDLVRSGDLLFVTSTDFDELKALKLDPIAQERQFVRAPNPIEALAIPVVSRPVALAHELRYVDGAEQYGRYVYARGAGSSEVSVVSADPAVLKEVKRLVAPGTVTALAARAPRTATDPSVLFVATASGTRASLWSVELPPLDQVAASTPSFKLLASVDQQTFNALLVLPAADELAISTHGPSGQGGQASILNLTSLTTRALQFPAPVRELVTHPKYASKAPGSDVVTTVQAGTHIFGILDEESCGLGVACTGVLAVDSTTGLVANDATGNPMLAIRTDRGLPMGLSITSSAQLLVPTKDSGPVIEQLALMGILTSSSGEVAFFDAAGLRAIDTNVSTGESATQPELFGPDGKKRERLPDQGPFDPIVGRGKARNERIEVVYNGVIPGFFDLPFSGTDLARYSSTTADFTRVLPGDTLVVADNGGDCVVELAVATVETQAVTTSTPAPAQCADAVKFSILAAGSKPYVVRGELTGYMGRTAAGETFEFLGTSSYRPNDLSPTQPQLTLSMGLVGDTERNVRYVFTTASGFVPYIVVLDTLSPGLGNAYLPGKVVHVPALQRAFIAYPSGDLIAEVNPAGLISSVVGNVPVYQ
jgi:hypothetical protein